MSTTGKMKVFLVDDNREAIKMLAFALQQAGCQIAVATSGAEALARIPTEQPDVVVLDVMMPQLDGFEVTQQLRARAETVDIPIILLTAKDQITDKVEGFGAGADDYLVKPVLPAELVVRIRALVRRAERYADSLQTRGRLIAFLGVKGGVGTTTLAVNVAIALCRGQQSVILADLSRYTGAAALQMGISPRSGLADVVDKEPIEISRRLLENALETHSSGVKLLAMPHGTDDVMLELTAEQAGAVLMHLQTMADIIVLDLGSGLAPTMLDAVRTCHLVVLIFEGDSVALSLARSVLEKLDREGIRGGNIAAVMVNRSRSAATYTRSDIEEELGRPLHAVITPAPEIAYHANKHNTPILISRPNTAIAIQLKQLSDRLA